MGYLLVGGFLMKLLFITARPPWPARRGDQARAAGLIEVLAERHEIRVLGLVGPSFKAEPPPIDAVTLEILRVPALWVGIRAVWGGIATLFGSRRPVQTALYDLPSLRHHAAEVVDEFKPDLVVVQLSRLADVLPALGGAPVLLDLIDSLALNMENRAAQSRWLGFFWRAEARRLLEWEKKAVAAAALSTVVAERDRAHLGGGGKLSVLPFGIEVPEELPRQTEKPEYELVLTGNLGYFPSVEGAAFFIREVWPLLCAAEPEIRLLLAGARPARSLKRLATTPGVDLIADPSDLRAELRRGALAIAPLRAGSGTPIKILEAMAEGVPVVATPAALAGLDGLPDGAAARAQSPGEFRDAILRLLADPAAAEAQRRVAFEWVRERHDRRAVAAAFEKLSPRADQGSGKGAQQGHHVEAH